MDCGQVQVLPIRPSVLRFDLPRIKLVSNKKEWRGGFVWAKAFGILVEYWFNGQSGCVKESRTYPKIGENQGSSRGQGMKNCLSEASFFSSRGGGFRSIFRDFRSSLDFFGSFLGRAKNEQMPFQGAFQKHWGLCLFGTRLCVFRSIGY